jgi:hypothetical protein
VESPITSAPWRAGSVGESRARSVARSLVLAFLVALGLLLLGYMFLGRGFAHLGFPPFYVGEAVLLLGLIATGLAVIAFRIRTPLSPVHWILLGFVALGVARTVPYLGLYRFDALRDAVLWGYAAFALMVYALADRAVVLNALRAYWWVVPVFAIWLPIAFNIFVVLSAGIQPDERGSEIPLVFFKSGDMAVHVVGALATLVLIPSGPLTLRVVALRAAVAAPLLWTAFVGGATNRGGLVTVVLGVLVIALQLWCLSRSSRSGFSGP